MAGCRNGTDELAVYLVQVDEQQLWAAAIAGEGAVSDAPPDSGDVDFRVASGFTEASRPRRAFGSMHRSTLISC
jgi:hypothetical protein